MSALHVNVKLILLINYFHLTFSLSILEVCHPMTKELKTTAWGRGVRIELHFPLVPWQFPKRYLASKIDPLAKMRQVWLTDSEDFTLGRGKRFHCADENNEAWEGQVTRPRSPSALISGRTRICTSQPPVHCPFHHRIKNLFQKRFPIP